MLFDQEELEAWLRQGRIGASNEFPVTAAPQELESQPASSADIIDIQTGRVYHRNALYR
jgi:hypothetical protein